MAISDLARQQLLIGGRAALEEFTELRRITIQGLPRRYPI